MEPHIHRTWMLALALILLAGCDDCRGRPDAAQNVLSPMEIVDGAIAEEIHLVDSTATGPYVPSHPELVIGTEALWLDGAQVVKLVRGTIPASDVRGGESGFHITPLHESLRRLRELPGNSDMTLTVTPGVKTPFRLFSRVLYTAGQAQILAYQFPVRDAEGGKHAIVIALPGHPSAPPRPPTPVLGRLGEPIPEATGEPPLNLMVIATPEGFRISAFGSEPPATANGPNEGLAVPLPEGWRDTCPASALEGREGLDLAPPACAYDFDELNRQLAALKQRASEERQLIFSADDNVEWEVVVRSLDAARGTPEAELFPDVVFASGI